jgi:hypothetical protein
MRGQRHETWRGFLGLSGVEGSPTNHGGPKVTPARLPRWGPRQGPPYEKR